jgi:hypothetical protein
MKKPQLLKAKRQKKREAASVVCCQINAAFIFSIQRPLPLAACRPGTPRLSILPGSKK